MPATENTWRNMPLMHLVFGVTSIGMLVSTVWLLSADYRREWKVIQGDARRIERTVLEWRTQEVDTLEYSQELAKLTAKLNETRAQAPSKELVQTFSDAVVVHALFAYDPGDASPFGTGTPPDGKLYSNELPESLVSSLTALDTNTDGAIDVDEVHGKLATPADKQSPELASAIKALREWGDNTDNVPAVGGVSLKQMRDDADAAAKLQAESKSAETMAERTRLRSQILTAMNAYSVQPRDQDDIFSRELKVMRGIRDADYSTYQLSITNGKSPAEQKTLLEKVVVDDRLVERLAILKQASLTYRGRLERVQSAIKADEGEAKKSLNFAEAKLDEIETARDRRKWNPLELPILEAFNSPVKIEQNWLPDLKLNYNLAYVARFDRCITCHRGIDKTLPGSPSEPAFMTLDQGHPIVIELPTPKQAPIPAKSDTQPVTPSLAPVTEQDLLLRRAFGMDLALNGLWQNQVAIDVVWDVASAERNGYPPTAVKAGLMAGDVIHKIGDTEITSREMGMRYLLESVNWGKPLKLTIHRGLPHPYSTHPRLDLYLGSFSPHKIMDFGCTVCHQGQGSATAFKWASHTPNTEGQKAAWQKKYGWFSSHDWPFLMYPQRFVESSCLKCHHEVTELEPSEKFPEPPAPKLVEGFDLIRSYGCFGCHEINGFEGPNMRIGPDLRAEPMYFAAAQQVLADPFLRKEPGKDDAAVAAEREEALTLAKEVVAYPERTEVRKKLAELIRKDAAPKPTGDSKKEEGKTTKAEPHFSPASLGMATVLGADNEMPGKYRKVGPSLRYVATKLDDAFLYDWLKNPTHFRPTTKMPRFFGLHDHLSGPDAITPASIRDYKLIIDLLTNSQPNSPAGRIADRLPASVKKILPLAGRDPGEAADAASRERVRLARKALADGLGALVHDAQLYDADAFATLDFKTTVPAPVKTADKDAPAAKPEVNDVAYFLRRTDGKTSLKRSLGDFSNHELEWLNRLLIEATFPDQIVPTTRVVATETQIDRAYRYEPIEALAVSKYLLGASEPFEYAASPAPEGSVERGKLLFQTRGCMACHTHDDPTIPHSKAHQGPDLSKLGGKFRGEKKRDWLYSWVKEPNRYHARTVMPNLFLDPIDSKGADGKPVLKDGKTVTTDPAADITEYLLSFQDWKPYETPKLEDKDPADQLALDNLVMVYLEKAFTTRQATRYVEQGIPADQAGLLKGDEAVLIAPITTDKKLDYIGRKTISRLGCAGCHDVPGFEDAKPIGTGLNAWGRKETSQLAFEQIATYLGISHGGHGGGHAVDHEAEAKHDMHDKPVVGHDGKPVPVEDPASVDFYRDSLGHHHRQGFIWQKIKEPRSYDYKMTGQKRYDDRLRMPQFSFTPAQREAIITFVLGLVAEPPEAKATRYVYAPPPRAKAIQEGKRIIEKYNCSGCHTLEMDRFDIAYDPVKFAESHGVAKISAGEDFPILHPYFTEEALAQSVKKDRKGLAHTQITGVKQPEEQEDDDGAYFYYELWKPAVIGGQEFRATQQIPLRDAQIVKHWPAIGGEFTRLIQPVALADEKKSNPNVKPNDALAWLPPPLMREGSKVQTDWLYRFLLNPYPIRPATILRMPKFNMSHDESRKLVNFFAATDNTEFPYESVPQRELSYREAHLTKNPQYFSNAFKIVADANVCTKCHRVGDYIPTGDPKAQAPDLLQVSNRFRPEFLTEWLARPKELLPYTGMPVNFPLDKPAHQDKFPGTQMEQLTGVRDLLLNFDRYLGSEAKIKEQIKLPAPMPAAGEKPAEKAAEKTDAK